ncbi:hypothetical protein F0562_014329 [Nyssa sinensis]|uniref:DUF4094 domain-containing protein n=1 Tax=Nyssa sinensis TaxID=561372 RepID=A0A5J4ZMJ0_9ASTE|nr:hypothetical protein F0562_014329 [Nyssa sinensis]
MKEEKSKMSLKSRGFGGDLSSKSVVSRNWALLLYLACFCAGMLFTNRIWMMPEANGIGRATENKDERITLDS